MRIAENCHFAKIHADDFTSIEKRNLMQAKEELNIAENKRRELDLKAKEALQELNRFKRDRTDLHVAQQQAETETEELQHQLEEQTPQGGKIEALERQLEEAENDKTFHSSSYQDAIDEKDKLRETHRLQEKDLAEIEEEIAGIDARINKATKKVDKLAEKRHNALLEKNQAFELIKDAEQDRDVLVQQREGQQARIENFMEQARAISERVPVDPGETASSLDKKLVKLDSDMKAYDQQYVISAYLWSTTNNPRLGGSANDIKIRAEEAKEKYEIARTQYEFLQQTAQVTCPANYKRYMYILTLGRALRKLCKTGKKDGRNFDI